MQQERPPAYTHEPDTLQLPSVPRHELPSIATATRHHLPGIKSLDLPITSTSRTSATNGSHGGLDLNPKPHGDPMQWHYMHPLSHTNFPQVPSTAPRNSTEVDIGSPMEVESVASAEDQQAQKAASVISMDDPDVRLAAEALSGLGNPDFVRSPTNRNLSLPRDRITHESEPLLSLLTSNHPWLGGTINGSISAYTTTKFYSPRFIQYGAELIERNIGSPVANTVSSVGRRTGVEKNLRRYLGAHRRPSDLETGDDALGSPGHKRRRVMSDPMDVESGIPTPRTRGDSQSSYADTLPAYDDHRSPQYEETAPAPGTAVVVVDPPPSSDPSQDQSQSQSQSQDRRVNWPTQLMITTSGLGAALSEGSLRSLKFCLGLLRSATQHVDTVMHALKLLLEDYEKAMRARQQSDGQSTPLPTAALTSSRADDSGVGGGGGEKEEQVRALAARMKHLSDDIWQTLKTVVSSVSRYTGGALPENAGVLVRRQLLSVPQRWRAAGESTAGEEREGRREEVRGAYRMLAFAREGLDMMAQVSTVVDGTIVSAETWLERMGRRREEVQEERGEKSEKEVLLGATGEDFGAREKRGG